MVSSSSLSLPASANCNQMVLSIAKTECKANNLSALNRLHQARVCPIQAARLILIWPLASSLRWSAVQVIFQEPVGQPASQAQQIGRMDRGWTGLITQFALGLNMHDLLRLALYLCLPGGCFRAALKQRLPELTWRSCFSFSLASLFLSLFPNVCLCVCVQVINQLRWRCNWIRSGQICVPSWQASKLASQRGWLAFVGHQWQ